MPIVTGELSGSGRRGAGSGLRGLLRRCSPTVAISAALVGLIMLGVVFASQLTAYDPLELSTTVLSPPDLRHLMGTDDLGRDVFARVLYGGRISLVVGLFSALISVGLGLSVGLLAGVSGGLVDEVLMRVTEGFQILPKLVVALVVVTMVGGAITNVIVVIGLLSWTSTARIVRSRVLVIRNEDFIAAAILSGASHSRLILRHVLPNVLALVIVSASTQVALAILAEASLSFLGLGDPTAPSWGQMLEQSQSFLREAWWMSLFPGLALALTILGLNLLGDGLNTRLSGTPQ